jgi:PBP1b-binding outer membrane lipoprotein LpoB
MNIYIPFLFSVLLLVSCSNNVQQDTATPAKTITSNDKQAPSNVTNPATSMPVDGSKTQTANATTDSLTINKTRRGITTQPRAPTPHNRPYDGNKI